MRLGGGPLWQQAFPCTYAAIKSESTIGGKKTDPRNYFSEIVNSKLDLPLGATVTFFSQVCASLK